MRLIGAGRLSNRRNDWKPTRTAPPDTETRDLEAQLAAYASLGEAARASGLAVAQALGKCPSCGACVR